MQSRRATQTKPMLPAAGERIGNFRLEKAMLMREPGPMPSLVRLGLVIGPVLIGAVLLFRLHSPTITPLSAKPATTAPSSIGSAAAAAPTNALAWSDAQISNPANVDTDLKMAAKLMVPAPPQTEPALQGVDPRRLRASFQRGIAAMQSGYSDSAINEGAGLVSMAAVLGYEPARATITREYPRSFVIRSAASSAEAVRYSLDPLLILGPQSESGRTFLVLLASYFSGRHELPVYATDLLATLSDDRRLQTEDRLKSLLELLARVPGACTGLSQAVVKARIVTGPECSPSLQLQIENFIRVTTPVGLEARSRRQAMQLLERSNRS
jgi:hypothetical protein